MDTREKDGQFVIFSRRKGSKGSTFFLQAESYQDGFLGESRMVRDDIFWKAFGAPFSVSTMGHGTTQQAYYYYASSHWEVY